MVIYYTILHVVATLKYWLIYKCIPNLLTFLVSPCAGPAIILVIQYFRSCAMFTSVVISSCFPLLFLRRLFSRPLLDLPKPSCAKFAWANMINIACACRPYKGECVSNWANSGIGWKNLDPGTLWNVWLIMINYHSWPISHNRNEWWATQKELVMWHTTGMGDVPHNRNVWCLTQQECVMFRTTGMCDV